MLAQQRREIITEMVREQGSLKVSELSEHFEVSQETIRRDIEKIEDEHSHIMKVHGGISCVSDRAVPVSVRKNLLLNEKMELAKRCISIIDDGDVIFLDCSTTSICIAKAISDSEKKVTVVSNSSSVSSEFSNSSTKLIIIGGVYHQDSDSYTGALAFSTLENLFANKAFISCPSINLESGIYDNDEEEALIRKTMIKNAKEAVLVVDHTKFDSFSSVRIADFTQIDVLVTNKILSADDESACRNLDIAII